MTMSCMDRRVDVYLGMMFFFFFFFAMNNIQSLYDFRSTLFMACVLILGYKIFIMQEFETIRFVFLSLISKDTRSYEEILVLVQQYYGISVRQDSIRSVVRFRLLFRTFRNLFVMVSLCVIRPCFRAIRYSSSTEYKLQKNPRKCNKRGRFVHCLIFITLTQAFISAFA